MNWFDDQSQGQCGITQNHREQRVLQELQNGLPLVARPYLALAQKLGDSEKAVLQSIRSLLENGTLKRLGIVVNHRELGYVANAMAVWQVDAAEVDRVGAAMAQEPLITLCYKRTPRPPVWPYNLYCMVHGKARDQVEAVVRALSERHGLTHVNQAVLFSTRQFKQCGGRYVG